jgi:hypothetical protein
MMTGRQANVGILASGALAAAPAFAATQELKPIENCLRREPKAACT